MAETRTAATELAEALVSLLRALLSFIVPVEFETTAKLGTHPTLGTHWQVTRWLLRFGKVRPIETREYWHV